MRIINQIQANNDSIEHGYDRHCKSSWVGLTKKPNIYHSSQDDTFVLPLIDVGLSSAAQPTLLLYAKIIFCMLYERVEMIICFHSNAGYFLNNIFLSFNLRQSSIQRQ